MLLDLRMAYAVVQPIVIPPPRNGRYNTKYIPDVSVRWGQPVVSWIRQQSFT